MTLRKHLLSMSDADASFAAELLDREIQDMPIETPCGEACKEAADATLAYCKAIDDVCGFVSEEARWEVWSHTVRAIEVMYFG